MQSPLLIIAFLTWREAVRRRIATVSGIAGGLVVAASLWALKAVVSALPVASAKMSIGSTIEKPSIFALSVVLCIAAAFLGAPAIGADIESGVTLAILPRPLSRAEFVCGKCLGLCGLLTVFILGIGLVEGAGVWIISGFRPAQPILVLTFLAVESIVALCAALVLGAWLPAAGAGIITILSFGIAWLMGIVEQFAENFHSANLHLVATVFTFAFPTDALGKLGASYLQPSPDSGTPSLWFAAWSVAWIGLVLAGSSYAFARRDL